MLLPAIPGILFCHKDGTETASSQFQMVIKQYLSAVGKHPEEICLGAGNYSLSHIAWTAINYFFIHLMTQRPWHPAHWSQHCLLGTAVHTELGLWHSAEIGRTCASNGWAIEACSGKASALYYCVDSSKLMGWLSSCSCSWFTTTCTGGMAKS